MKKIIGTVFIALFLIILSGCTDDSACGEMFESQFVVKKIDIQQPPCAYKFKVYALNGAKMYILWTDTEYKNSDTIKIIRIIRN